MGTRICLVLIKVRQSMTRHTESFSCLETFFLFSDLFHVRIGPISILRVISLWFELIFGSNVSKFLVCPQWRYSFMSWWNNGFCVFGPIEKNSIFKNSQLRQKSILCFAGVTPTQLRYFQFWGQRGLKSSQNSPNR